MTSHTYTVDYTCNSLSGRATETKVFYYLREAKAFIANNVDAAGYVMRQTYTSDYAPASGNTLLMFFGGFEQRMAASESAKLVALCGTDRLLPSVRVKVKDFTTRAFKTGKSLIIPAFSASGLKDNDILEHNGLRYELKVLHAGGAARFALC